MMQLDDFKVPGFNLRVKGTLEIRTEDMAGETSGTDSVEKGIKPKLIRVSVNIRFADSDDLNALVKRAEAVETSGKRKIYTVTDKTANAAGVRQARFTDFFNWNSAENGEYWKVTFTLAEYLSNPERVEKQSLGVLSATDPTTFDKIASEAENLLI